MVRVAHRKYNGKDLWTRMNADEWLGDSWEGGDKTFHDATAAGRPRVRISSPPCRGPPRYR